MSMVSFALCCHHLRSRRRPREASCDCTAPSFDRTLGTEARLGLRYALGLRHAWGSRTVGAQAAWGSSADFELRPDRGPDQGPDRGPNRGPNRGPVTAHLFRALAGVLPMGGLL